MLKWDIDVHPLLNLFSEQTLEEASECIFNGVIWNYIIMGDDNWLITPKLRVALFILWFLQNRKLGKQMNCNG